VLQPTRPIPVKAGIGLCFLGGDYPGTRMTVLCVASNFRRVIGPNRSGTGYFFTVSGVDLPHLRGLIDHPSEWLWYWLSGPFARTNTVPLERVTKAAVEAMEAEGSTKRRPEAAVEAAEAEGSTKRRAKAAVEREGPTKAKPVSEEPVVKAEAAVECEAPTKATSAKVCSAKTSSTVNGRRGQRRAGHGDHRSDHANRYFAHHGYSLHIL
jgi:hypothetical protein